MNYYIGTARRLANGGYAVYGIDYEGHGKSYGLPGLVKNFDTIIDDCFRHFSSICGKHLLFLFSIHSIQCLPLNSTFYAFSIYVLLYYSNPMT